MNVRLALGGFLVLLGLSIFVRAVMDDDAHDPAEPYREPVQDDVGRDAS